jgi:hypothetical protein
MKTTIISHFNPTETLRVSVASDENIPFIWASIVNPDFFFLIHGPGMNNK